MTLKATFTVTYSEEDPPITKTESHIFSIEEEMEKFLLAFAKKQKWDKGLGGEDNEETENQAVEVLESMGYNIPDNEIEETVEWFYWDPIFKFSPNGSAWLDRPADSVILEKV